RKYWFKGRPVRKKGLTDIAWFLPEGTEMTEEHWKSDFAKSLGVFFYGGGLNTVDENNHPLTDDNFYIIFNAYSGSLDFKLPEEKFGKTWKKAIDTGCPADGQDTDFTAGGSLTVGGNTVLVLQSAFSPIKR
ncbi:MAG: glycogen debranching enzyme GlgX, partial [Bacteroidota bacterium]